MANIESKNIIISFIIGLIVNIISFYLFTLKVIDIFTFIFIVIGFILLILIIGIQIRYSELKEELEQIKTKHEELNRNLKIHERLTKLEVIIDQYAKKK